MNRIIVIIAVVALIIIGVIAAILNLTDPNNQASNQTLVGNNADNAFVRVDACDILTKKIVEDSFGGTVSGTTPVKGGSSNNDMLVTTCSLTSRTGNKTNGTAMLLARVALNEVGAGSNLQEFDDNKPPESVDVEGIGDRAYYIPSFNQLNVIVGNNWYILSSYKDGVLDGTLEDAKTLAQKLNFQ